MIPPIIFFLLAMIAGCKPVIGDQRGAHVVAGREGAQFDQTFTQPDEIKEIVPPPSLELPGVGIATVLTGTSLDHTVPRSTCYRYNFISRPGSDSTLWENGDGATFVQLGDEVAQVVAAIRKKNSSSSLVLIAHSRGGLASRSYLQSIVADKDFKLGLLTIGTPHRGTPLGMIKYYYAGKSIGPGELPFDALKFIMSPSLGYLAQAFANAQPARNAFSEEISKLEEKVPELLKSVAVLGQMYSVGLAIGENAAPGLDLFASSILNPARLLPGDFDEMKSFIFAGVPDNWQDGDNMVPAISAKISNLSGVEGSGVPLLSTEMNRKVHSDSIQFDIQALDSNPNGGITGQIGMIQLMLEGMTNRPGFTKFLIRQ